MNVILLLLLLMRHALPITAGGNSDGVARANRWQSRMQIGTARPSDSTSNNLQRGRSSTVAAQLGADGGWSPCSYRRERRHGGLKEYILMLPNPGQPQL